MPVATVVAYSAPGKALLVHWHQNDDATPIIVAELDRLRAATNNVRRQRLPSVTIVSDALAAVHMVCRGVSRNSVHAPTIRAALECALEVDLVWVPSAANPADGPSRGPTRAQAKASIREPRSLHITLHHITRKTSHNLPFQVGERSQNAPSFCEPCYVKRYPMLPFIPWIRMTEICVKSRNPYYPLGLM